METFNIPVLVTLEDGSEEVRKFQVEAWDMNGAMRVAERYAYEDEQVVNAVAQVRVKQ